MRRPIHLYLHANVRACLYTRDKTFHNPHPIMLSKKDYSNMPLEDLLAEEKKLKSQKILTAVLVGFFLGVAVYAATHKGFLTTIAMLIFAFAIGSNYSKSVKSIEAEISRRNTTQP